MIHYILCKEGFNVSLKRVQRNMSELSLYSITVKNIDLIQLKSSRRFRKRFINRFYNHFY